MALPKPELNPHLHDDVDRRSLHAPGCESPLAHGIHRALVQSATQAADETHLADGAVSPHHDLELDFAFDVCAPCLVGVIGAHFAQQARWLHAAAGTERPPAVAAAGSFADA